LNLPKNLRILGPPKFAGLRVKAVKGSALTVSLPKLSLAHQKFEAGERDDCNTQVFHVPQPMPNAAIVRRF
jgi:hypothetical protein